MSRIKRSDAIYKIYEFLPLSCVNCKIYKFNDFLSLSSAKTESFRAMQRLLMHLIYLTIHFAMDIPSVNYNLVLLRPKYSIRSYFYML